MAAAAAVLPPRAPGVAMKTPALTVMVGAQTTINNQLNASTATATEMVMTMTMETKATAAAEERRQLLGGGGQLGGSGGSLARAWRQQRGGGVCSESVAAVEAAAAWLWLVRGSLAERRQQCRHRASQCAATANKVALPGDI